MIALKSYLSILLCVLFMVNAHAQQDRRSYKKEIKKHRKSYKKKFLNIERSPLGKKDLKYLRFYKADQTYKLTGPFTRTTDSPDFEMSTYSGKTKVFKKYGFVELTRLGQPIKVNIYQNQKLSKMPQYKDYLFIPFKDHTNDGQTYGGGRYIDIKIEDIQDGTLTLDFNKCYNPWCAFSDGYNCPVPPKENHLELAIEAGEKMFAKKKKNH